MVLGGDFFLPASLPDGRTKRRFQSVRLHYISMLSVLFRISEGPIISIIGFEKFVVNIDYMHRQVYEEFSIALHDEA